ncbi:MAG: type II secretion system F family protein [Alphaproteobacteria bacterium]
MFNASARALIVLFLHLEQMEKAGVPITQSLATARDAAEEKIISAALDGVLHEIKNGQKLHEAMTFYPKVFDETMIGLIKLGEKSGKLARVFGQCLEYVRRRDEHARMMRKATREPKISGAVIFGLAIFKNHTALPWVAALLAFFITLFIAARRYILPFRYITDRLFLTIPKLGPLVAQDSWAHFAESLAMLYEAGVDMRSGLRIAAAGIPNLIIREAAERAIPPIEAGSSLHAAFRDTKRMDKMALAMIKAGEDTGNFSQTLRELADYYEKRTAEALTALQQVSTPILTIILGIVLFVTL